MCFKNKKKDSKKKVVLKEKKKLEKYLVKRNKYKNSKLYLIKKIILNLNFISFLEYCGIFLLSLFL